jgi:hypothetical protein
MSQYIKSPFKPVPVLAVAGTPTYLLGSWNDKTGPTLGYVQSNSAVTTTGTLVFRIVSGNVPVTGSLITVIGTGNSSGVFNVSNVAITVVSVTDAGIATVTYAISSTSQASLADGGQVEIPQPEVGENVASFPYASVPVARPFNNPNIQEGQSISATLNLGAGLSAVTAVLQGADFDIDSEYTTIHTFGTSGLTSFQSGQDSPASAGASTPGAANTLNFRFYRFNLSAGTGSGLVIGKIEF